MLGKQAENPDWRIRLVYVLQDPRARLAELKLKGKYVSPTGIQLKIMLVLNLIVKSWSGLTAS
jgi:hypothetical protein